MSERNMPNIERATPRCVVSLVRKASKAPCDLGHGFGCYDGEDKMYVTHGCYGRFVCGGTDVRCGSYEWPPVTNCTCVEAVLRNEQAASGEGTATSGRLHVQSLHGPLAIKRLVPRDTFHRQPRFVPNNQNETFAAIFTWWNLLDRLMFAHEPKHNFAVGYMREVQLRRMYQLALRPKPIRRYCEIGLNGGHSAVAMLLTLPRVRVRAFDLLAWGYSRPVIDLLSQHFQDRFEIVAGDSATTVPSYAANRTLRRRDRCDLTFIDGSHARLAALRDLRNMQRLSAPGARVLVDDIGAAPGCDVRDAQDAGLVAVDEVYGPYDAPSRHNPCRNSVCTNWGFCVLRYTQPATKANASASWSDAFKRDRRERVFAFLSRGRSFSEGNPGGYRELTALKLRCWQSL